MIINNALDVLVSLSVHKRASVLLQTSKDHLILVSVNGIITVRSLKD